MAGEGKSGEEGEGKRADPHAELKGYLWRTVAEEKAEQKVQDGRIVRDTVFVAPRNGPTRRVDTAPETSLHQSKRFDQLTSQAHDLDRKKSFLREQALEKERVFKRNVANLRTRIAEFRLKVDEEVEARDAQHADAKASFDEHLRGMREYVEDQQNGEVAVAEEQWLPHPADRLDLWEADFDHFVNVTVPETIENQSGRVTRHLIKAQETFEIDNAKLMKRERKINERHEFHVADAQKNMTEVVRKRKDCFVLVEEDIYAEERDSDRAEERHFDVTHHRVEEVQTMKSGLAQAREDTDVAILETINVTMARLQTSVLENFGAGERAEELSDGS